MDNLWQSGLDGAWLLFLIVLFRYFWQTRSKILHARSWIKTTGLITHCELQKAGHQLWPKIKYQYQVNEQNLIGEHIFLDTTHINPNSLYARRIAYQIANAYKDGLEIAVYYNPSNPNEVILDTTVPKKLNIILLLILFFMALHLIIIGARILA